MAKTIIKLGNKSILADKTIQTARGTKKLYAVSIEDRYGRWDDSYDVRRGYWVIHKGKIHLIYK